MTDFNQAVERESDRLYEALRIAEELILELRTYADDWDWKHGERWDKEQVLISGARAVSAARRRSQTKTAPPIEG